MKLTPILGITAVMFILSACATGPRKVSMAEATTSENQIISATRNQPVPPQPEKLYTQPVNKTEPCKLPTSKEQLERRNFRSYWDGDCKDGYAYGLGRDIALSDTHHFEEITIYNGNGDSKGQPYRFIDYVHNRGGYGVSGATWGSVSGYSENITSDSTEFSIQYRAGIADDQDRSRYLAVISSPFSPVRATVNQSHEKLVYVLMDLSALPATSDQPQYALFAAVPGTMKPIGFRIVRFRNGAIQHQKVAADGQSIAELVQLPSEYIAHLTSKIDEAQTAAQKAITDATMAQQMEREYLHMACATDYSINGVPAKDMEIARQICTWRDQWKEPYARAETRYKQEMEQKQREVVQAEQQRAYVAAQQAQAAAAQSAAFSASMNQMNQALQQQNNNTLQQINQMNQQLQHQNNQMMESWAPQQNKTTICNRIGNQVFCR
ncbi:hypothetical protein [Nitrincola nitratireducens]|uniref:Uncharacterized protein n=1 Tax=Nitrincola nitratireducens TaxID=1229521 RepID=W9VFH2_9GAMM|nr:hypothetical protein [Nitrincola nitratireducens]EXJ09420.1 hypothetical protein D791_03579 [Nitrincola nitratireducens]